MELLRKCVRFLGVEKLVEIEPGIEPEVFEGVRDK
jgi:hypothetical protein